MSKLGSRGIVLLFVVKTKALISCTVNGQHFCFFVFAYGKGSFLMTRLECRRQINGNDK